MTGDLRSGKDTKTTIAEMEKEAFVKYTAGHLAEAQILFQKILSVDAKHSLANFYLDKIKKQQMKNKAATTAPIPLSVEGSKITDNSMMAGDNVVHQRLTPTFKKSLPAEEIPRSETTKKNFPALSEMDAQKKLPDAALGDKNSITKVLIVDDSSLMRKVIGRILAKSPAIRVVGEANNGEEALQAIPKLQPNVITLDVNMPVMDGLTMLKHIVISDPLPVIMLSAFTDDGASTTFDCLTYGAVDFICKPSKEGGNLSGKEDEIIQKVLNASRVEVQPLKKVRGHKSITKGVALEGRAAAQKAIVIGAGEGGYGGFLKILPHLPAHLPCAILAVQYMEENYFEAFCNYLNQYSHIVVKKAEDRELIREGVCYIVNQKVYLKVQSGSEGYQCQVAKKPDFLMQQNVFNQLLFSAAETFNANAIGVVLAGKGIDGIEGICEIKRVHGTTLSQDPKNCVTPQLSEIAIKSGSIDRVVNDTDFPGVLWHLVKK
jgi:two-component system chemotaxis response regulator CheB